MTRLDSHGRRPSGFGAPGSKQTPLTMNTTMAHRPRETRHRKTTSTTSSASTTSAWSAAAPFPAIDEALHHPPQLYPVLSSEEPPLRPGSLSKFPGDLDLSTATYNAYRDRSPTSSTMSSSAFQPDTATTYSVSMSPTSSTFTRATTPDVDMEELGRHAAALRVSTCSPRRHRKGQSCDSATTFVDSVLDEERPGCFGADEIKPDGEPKDEDMPGTPNTGQYDPLQRSTNTLRPQPEDAGAGTPPTKGSDEGENLTYPPGRRFNFGITPDLLGSRTTGSSTPEPPLDVTRDETDDVLSYVLQSIYGVDLEDVTGPPALLRHVTSRFIRDIGRVAFHGPPPGTHFTNGTPSSSVPIPRNPGSGSYPPGRNSQGAGGKRKKGMGSGGGRGDDGGGDGDSSDEDDGGAGAPFKRPKQMSREEDEKPRLSCPFRKRNQARFNVREHHSCAMTYFPGFPELRQHIVKQHKRTDPSAFVCDRCNRDFASREDLRDHQRQPKELMCDITENDPESGIDGATATKLLSRKRASGMTSEVQWREIWGLLFPDDDDQDIHSWDFCPVIEHFEVTSRFMHSLKALEGSLLNKGLNESALETIGNLYRNQLIQIVEQTVEEARSRPYANRSNRGVNGGGGGNGRVDVFSAPSTASMAKATPPPTMWRQQGRQGRIMSRPDSGVDVDEGSSEEGSLSIALMSSTPSTCGYGADDFQGFGLRRSSSSTTDFRASGMSVGPGGRRSLMPLMEQTSQDDGSAAVEAEPAYDQILGFPPTTTAPGLQSMGHPQDSWPGATHGDASAAMGGFTQNDLDGRFAEWDPSMLVNPANLYSYPYPN